MFKMVDKVADSEATIMIQGESGTGKELIAREIHYRSRRAHGPFVSINCGAIPRDLLESNLFGHVKGSFTGAVRDSAGLFQVAEGGTFFLDEVGEMPLATQVKLLRALQEREIIPVGGTQPIKIDCRLVAATNADLEKRGRRGPLPRRPVLPPQRDSDQAARRCASAATTSRCWWTTSSSATPRISRAKTVSKEAMELLMKYDWPGNVRELENVMERALILDEGGVIGPEDLPDKIRFGHSHRGSLVIDSPTLTLEELEKEYILKVLNHTRWQKKRASEILGINASTLYRKLIALRGREAGRAAGRRHRRRATTHAA